MSTKRFCDLCQKPAVERVNRAQLQKNLGEPWRGFRAEKGCEGVWQPKIVATVVFAFQDHQTGYGGPPDLCADCAANLTAELSEFIKHLT